MHPDVVWANGMEGGHVHGRDEVRRGIDLGKTTFHLVALDEHGTVVIKKKFSRQQLLAYTGNLQGSLIGIEA
jgi:hypothetical protein